MVSSLLRRALVKNFVLAYSVIVALIIQQIEKPSMSFVINKQRGGGNVGSHAHIRKFIIVSRILLAFTVEITSL